MKLQELLYMANMMLAASCDEREVALALADRIKFHFPEQKETMDGEIVFLSKKTMEEEYAID